ncbi:hypothetical protein [Teredinibacter turnerae]|uniref:hypothetical protein n=1 Tax=Teredinibacter turnerae TaxID=2426 RepID=UPI00040BFCCE|nr:hypothetical protein [Teredinibacter turnerae]
MAVVEVVFTNAHNVSDQSGLVEDIPLFFNTFDFSPAEQWLDLLKETLDAKVALEEHQLNSSKVLGRFVGFPGAEKSKKQLTDLINNCIDTVNTFAKDAIPISASESCTQDDLNELHKYFELHRGPRLNPGWMFVSGPESVKNALENFNLYIHEYEARLRSTSGEGATSFSKLDITFKGPKRRIPLRPEDFNYFSPHSDFGGVYLHYCDVGKQVLDVYYDQDSAVGIDNIRPLEFISADFDIYFGMSNKQWFGMEYKTKLEYWLKEHGMDPRDPKLGIGFLKIGQMIPDARFKHLDRSKFLSMFSNYLNIKSIHVHGTLDWY